MVLGNVVIRIGGVNVADPHVSEELAAVLVLFEDLLEVFLDILHSLMIGRHTCSYQAVRMGIPVEDVNATLCY